MNIKLDRSKDRLFNKHDSGFGKPTLLLTFDKQPLRPGDLMQLTAFGGELIGEIIEGLWVEVIHTGFISKRLERPCTLW